MQNLIFPGDAYRILTFRQRFWLLFNRYYITVIGVGVALAVGVALGGLTPTLGRQNSYRLLVILMSGFMLLGMLITRQPKRILLFFFVLAIPFNLRFTPFVDNLAYHSGGAPPAVLIYVYDFPLIGLLGLFLMEITLHRKPLRFGAVDLLAVLFILWNVVGIFRSVDVTLSLYESFRIFKLYLAGYIVMFFVRNKTYLRDIAIAFFVALMLQSFFSVLQYFLAVDLSALGGFTVGSVRRVSGTVGWPNTFGVWVAVVLAIAAGYWICKVIPRWNGALFLIIVIGALPLAVSFSRGAWLASGVGVAVMYALAWLRRWLKPADFFKLMLIALVALAAGLYFSDAIAARAARDTISVRYDLNDIAVRMFQSAQITGVGVNTFVLNMEQFDPTGVASYFAEPVHNIYLLILAENGLVGLLLFMLMNLAAGVIGLKAVFSTDRLISATGIAYLGALVVVLFSNIVDVHLKFDPIFSLYFVLLAILSAAAQIDAEQKAQP